MNTLILGLGVSGKAASAFLLAEGRNVIGFDDQHASIIEDLNFSTIEQVVVSPGIAPSHPVYQKALALGIEVVGEAEVALRRIQQPCIGITGTNGKTTVTLLVEHILKYVGIAAKALGNVGVSLSSYCLTPDPKEVLVVELSSYQLETMKTPAFDVGVILNVAPDHLDRHISMQGYVQAKCRLQRCLKQDATLYVDEEMLRDYDHLLVKDQLEVYCNRRLPPIEEKLAAHDRKNLRAAWALVQEFGVSEKQFQEALKSFKKPPHRIEFVAEVEGVRYYNDSKGTNIAAVISAVEAMPAAVVLLAGGVDKGVSYAAWKRAFAQKVKKLVVFGQAASKIEKELSEDFLIEKVDSLEHAVNRAAHSATAGECVLLSPGGASYDMFCNYEHRGDEFKRYVHERRNT